MSYPLSYTHTEPETEKEKGTILGITKLDQPEPTHFRSIAGGLQTGEPEPSTSTIEKEEDQDAPPAPDEEWLDGLTDLFFYQVGALATFNEDHELSTKAQLVNFAAYFMVIWWIWVSQILLDLKFQTSDGFTRFIKIYQLLIFATLGSYSAKMDITFPLAEGFTSEQMLATGWFSQEEANVLPIFNDKDTKSALQAFAIVYIISRAVLVLQYIRREVQLYISYGKQPISTGQFRKPIFFPILSGTISAIAWAVGYVLLTRHPSSKALAITRLVLWFGGIGVELAAEAMVTLVNGYIKFRRTQLGTRVGLFTLIILGESIISIVQVGKFLVGGSGYSVRTYIQLLCSFLVIYCVWFASMASCLNFLNAADVANRLQIIVYNQTLNFILDHDVKNLLYHPAPGLLFNIQDENNKEIINFMNELGFLSEANTTFYQVLAENGFNGSQQDLLNQANQAILSEEYKLDIAIIIGEFKEFRINLDEETIYTGRGFTISDFVSFDNYWEWIAQVSTDSLKPSLFLLPVAGGFLISIVALRLNTRLPKGHQHIREDGIYPLIPYKLVAAEWLIPTVLIIFATIVISEQVLLFFVRRAYTKKCQWKAMAPPLPTEILHEIFQEAIYDYPDTLHFSGDPAMQGRRNPALEDLKSVSLVCNSWTAMARRLIIMDCSIFSRKQVAFIKSACKKNGTRDLIRRLRLSCFQKGKSSTLNPMVGGLLNALPSLRELIID
ncbi:hypothetical protein BT69DRAFT_1321246 [Atractiella rhizophila]|nr:hypothetical protein BT69DRAFT_1321246 [Atractiella rhizophila]